MNTSSSQYPPTNINNQVLAHCHSRSQIYSQAHPTSSGLSSDSCADANPSFFEPKPVARTFSSSSNLYLQKGSLQADHNTQNFSSATPILSSSSTSQPSASTLSSSSYHSSSPTSTFVSHSALASRPSASSYHQYYQHHQQKKQHQRAQQYTKREMHQLEEGSHVQDTIVPFTQSMADSKVNQKSLVVLPLMTINTPMSTSVLEQASSLPSLSPSSERSTISASSEACSPVSPWTKTQSSPLSSSPTTYSINGTTSVEQPPLLISEPLVPKSIVPSAITGTKSTPSCNSLLDSVSRSSPASASLFPLVGRDYMSYSSLNAALVTGKVASESRTRPLSSMEYAESWLPTSVSITNPATEAVVDIHTSCMNNSDHIGGTKAVVRIPSDQQPIHPFQLGPDHDTNTFQEQDRPAKLPVFNTSFSQKELPRRPVIRKKASFAAKLRNVFIGKQYSSQSVETQEDIISLSSSDDEIVNISYQRGDYHRGSVSSNSSVDTTLGHDEFNRDLGQTITPLTSPDISPLSSPTIKSTTNMVTTASNQHSSSESSLACSLSSWDVDNGTKFDLSLPRSQSTLASTNQTSTQPTPTRTIKKKLSFASISSFFGSRNLQERRAKQQRSSSLPHVENPLVAVGRQIAGFQRRSSLNDIHDNGTKTKTQSAHDRIIPPWEKNNISHQINIPSSVPAPSPFLEVATRTPTKKLSFNNVFNKQLKKRKNVNTKPAPPVPAKPLKSALVHRSPSFAAAKAHIVHTRRRSASVRSQSSSIRRHQQQRHLQNSPQRQSRQPPCPSDTLARLAEANQALASLRKPLLPGDYDVCLSQTLDAPEDMVPQANTVSPPKPRVNPVMTRGVLAASKARSDPNYSPPLNPLATLSRSSSYCSFSSSPEGVDVSRSYNAEDGGSFSSSTYSTQFEVSTPNIYLQQQQQQPRSESIENGQTTPGHNSLLPASAARISVDQIAVDTQTKQQSSAYDVDDMLAGNLFSTFEFSSTMSNSTAASSTSSPSDNNVTHSSGNSIYRSLHGYPHQQSNYQQLKHQQQQFLAPEYYQPYEHQYYIEGQNDQVQGQSLFIDLTPQQDCQYQTYYYEDITYSPRPSRQLQFSTEGPIIHETWTPEQYDRTSDPNITASHLTPAIAQTIKLELNQFKSQEMEVHQDSRMYTHFFI